MLPNRDNQAANPEEELPLYCGEIVPCSGIYQAIHTHAHSDGMVIALRGQPVEPCKACGDQVRLRLLYAAPHLSEDGDFNSNN